MDIEDLRRFTVIARLQNLQKAAEYLHSSPSALSKSLKRLETSLSVQLFDRVGKQIKINASGRKLMPQAIDLLDQADKTKQQFTLQPKDSALVIAAPPIFQLRWARKLRQLQQKYFSKRSLVFKSQFERQALQMLIDGEADAIIVSDYIASEIPIGFQQITLGLMDMQVAVGNSHPLVTELSLSGLEGVRPMQDLSVLSSHLLEYEFATVTRSMICGEERGIGCDGWNDSVFPRKLSAVVDDYGVLASLVKSGLYLGYLPDFIIKDWELNRCQVTDCSLKCVDSMIWVTRENFTLQMLNNLLKG